MDWHYSQSELKDTITKRQSLTSLNLSKLKFKALKKAITGQCITLLALKKNKQIIP
jgi:hypothetical protein